jgi:D-alanyl-D-alanine dipeptidase
MSYPHSAASPLDEHVPAAHHGNSDAREVLTAALLGIGLMAMTTVWWWFAMR